MDKKYQVTTYKGVIPMTMSERASVYLIPGVDRAPNSFLPPDTSRWHIFSQSPEVRLAKLAHLELWMKAMQGDRKYPDPWPGDKPVSSIQKSVSTEHGGDREKKKK